MTDQAQLVAIFAYLDDLLAAITALRERRFTIQSVHSPVPNQEIAAAMGQRPSPVRAFALVGAIVGILAGFGLSVYTAMQWRFVVSGKPPVPTVPYVIESFEFCILFGVLFNLAGLLFLMRLPRPTLPAHYDPRVTEDRFSLVVMCPRTEREAVSRLLDDVGAEEVHAFD